jgi:hypothetical protein
MTLLFLLEALTFEALLASVFLASELFRESPLEALQGIALLRRVNYEFSDILRKSRSL